MGTQGSTENLGTPTKNSISKFCNILQVFSYDLSDVTCVYVQWFTGEKFTKYCDEEEQFEGKGISKCINFLKL